MTIPSSLARQSSFAKSSFNPSVHGARGLLALLVFVFHVARAGLPGWGMEGNAALISLQFGVEIFFCISGFVAVASLRRSQSPASFLKGRAIRILPVLWATLAIIIPLGLLTHQRQFDGVAAHDLAWIIPANLFAIAGVFPLPVLHLAAWSLSYELAFYCFAAALWWLPVRHKWLRRSIWLLAAACIVWRPRAMFFVLGMLVARVDIGRNVVLRHALRAPGLALCAFAACWYVVQFQSGENGEGSMLAWAHDGQLGMAAIAIALAATAFSGIVAGQGLLCALLQSSLFQWLGTLSYSFYLWHVIVMAVVKRVFAVANVTAMVGDWSQILMLAVSLPLSIGAAYASVRIIEQGATRWLSQKRSLPSISFWMTPTMASSRC